MFFLFHVGEQLTRGVIPESGLKLCDGHHSGFKVLRFKPICFLSPVKLFDGDGSVSAEVESCTVEGVLQFCYFIIPEVAEVLVFGDAHFLLVEFYFVLGGLHESLEKLIPLLWGHSDLDMRQDDEEVGSRLLVEYELRVESLPGVSLVASEEHFASDTHEFFVGIIRGSLVSAESIVYPCHLFKVGLHRNVALITLFIMCPHICRHLHLSRSTVLTPAGVFTSIRNAKKSPTKDYCNVFGCVILVVKQTTWLSKLCSGNFNYKNVFQGKTEQMANNQNQLDQSQKNWQQLHQNQEHHSIFILFVFYKLPFIFIHKTKYYICKI